MRAGLSLKDLDAEPAVQALSRQLAFNCTRIFNGRWVLVRRIAGCKKPWFSISGSARSAFTGKDCVHIYCIKKEEGNAFRTFHYHYKKESHYGPQGCIASNFQSCPDGRSKTSECPEDDCKEFPPVAVAIDISRNAFYEHGKTVKQAPNIENTWRIPDKQNRRTCIQD